MLILSLLAMKLCRSFLAFFVRFWKQMQCIVSQSLPFLVLQNAYLVAKIQIYIGLEQTIILKKIISQLLLTLLFKYHCKLYMNQRLFGTTIVTNKMNGYDNKPVLMK